MYCRCWAHPACLTGAPAWAHACRGAQRPQGGQRGHRRCAWPSAGLAVLLGLHNGAVVAGADAKLIDFGLAVAEGPRTAPHGPLHRVAVSAGRAAWPSRSRRVTHARGAVPGTPALYAGFPAFRGTQRGHIMAAGDTAPCDGTVGYISPCRPKRSRVTPSIDIYAFGCLLKKMFKVHAVCPRACHSVWCRASASGCAARLIN